MAGPLLDSSTGGSLFLVSVLKHVPMAVLFGLFLTMGITSLTTIQLWERISLLFMEPKLYPPTSYVRQVSRVKLHTFTFVQILGFLVLYVVKKSAFAMCFPLVILCFVPIRNVVLPMFFSERELHYLDSEDVVEEEDEGDLAPKCAHSRARRRTTRGRSAEIPPPPRPLRRSLRRKPLKKAERCDASVRTVQLSHPTPPGTSHLSRGEWAYCATLRVIIFQRLYLDSLS